MKMYEVTAKCGHVGRHYYVVKSFPVKAVNAREAASVVRHFPRVKHHHKDAILSVKEITEEAFTELILRNNNDPYMTCGSIQEQRECCDLDLIPDMHSSVTMRRREAPSTPVYHHKNRIRRPKRYTAMCMETSIEWDSEDFALNVD